jgi:hypothetical protein
MGRVRSFVTAVGDSIRVRRCTRSDHSRGEVARLSNRRRRLRCRRTPFDPRSALRARTRAVRRGRLRTTPAGHVEAFGHCSYFAAKRAFLSRLKRVRVAAARQVLALTAHCSVPKLASVESLPRSLDRHTRLGPEQYQKRKRRARGQNNQAQQASERGNGIVGVRTLQFPR